MVYEGANGVQAMDLVGRKLADQYGFKVGDVIPLKGTIYPGNWEFVVRGIYEGRQSNTNTSTMFFHWEYVNESLKVTAPRRVNQIGVYVVQIRQPENAAAISAASILARTGPPENCAIMPRPVTQ